jgi:hypothetical protein
MGGCVLFEFRTVRGIVLAQGKPIASSPGYRRSIAASVAALLLLAQLIASAHVHPGFLLKGLGDGAHFLSDAACPICVFHAHAPISGTTAPVLERPLAGEGFVALAFSSRLFVIPKPQLFGRAPPASV